MIGPSLDIILTLQTLIAKKLASHLVSAREIHSLLGQMESMPPPPPTTRWQGSQMITRMACERSLVSGKLLM